MTRTGTRVAGILAALAVVAVVSGCGTALPEAKESPTTSAPMDEAAGDDSPSTEEIDLMGSLLAGDPPTDLLWSLPDSLPKGWTQMPTDDEKGVVQVEVTRTCLIDFRQPANMGTDPDPESIDVASDYATEVGEKGLGLKFTVSPLDSVKFEGDVNEGKLNTQLDFAKVHFEAPEDPQVEGVVYALRDGDFALIASAMCGGGAFADQGDSMQRFIESSHADVTY